MTDGKKRFSLARDSLCAICEGLLHAALGASREYHTLMGTLEAAHICHDTRLLFSIQKNVAEALQNRDHEVNALMLHEHTHAPAPVTMKTRSAAR